MSSASAEDRSSTCSRSSSNFLSAVEHVELAHADKANADRHETGGTPDPWSPIWIRGDDPAHERPADREPWKAPPSTAT